MRVRNLLELPQGRDQQAPYPYYDHLRYKNACDAAGQLLVLHRYNQMAGLTFVFGCEIRGKAFEWRRNGISKKSLNSLPYAVKMDLALAGIASNIIRFDFLDDQLDHDDIETRDRRRMVAIDGQSAALQAVYFHAAPPILLADLLQRAELRAEWCAAQVERIIELLMPHKQVLARLTDDLLPRSGQPLRLLKSASGRIEELIAELMPLARPV